MWQNRISVYQLNVWVFYHSQTVMETFQHQLPWCLRWCSRCIDGLRPQRHWLNRWWPYTKEQVKFHPVQLKDVHTATVRLRQKFAYFFSTKPEFVMPSGNLFHVSRRDRFFSKSCQILFIHLVFCLTTGPKRPPRRFLHIVWSRASSFKWEYPLLSLRLSSSFLHLLPCLSVTSIPPFNLPSITRCRRQIRYIL